MVKDSAQKISTKRYKIIYSTLLLSLIIIFIIYSLFNIKGTIEILLFLIYIIIAYEFMIIVALKEEVERRINEKFKWISVVKYSLSLEK